MAGGGEEVMGGEEGVVCWGRGEEVEKGGEEGRREGVHFWPQARQKRASNWRVSPHDGHIVFDLFMFVGGFEFNFEQW